MRFANPSKKTRVLSSLKGLHIEFPGKVPLDAKGKPIDPAYKVPHGGVLDKAGLVFIHVPPALHQECIAANLEPETAMEEPDEATLPKKPESALDLEKQLFDAFDMIVEAARREDFAASGLPKAESIEKLTGYAVTNAEVRDTWQKYQQTKKAS